MQRWWNSLKAFINRRQQDQDLHDELSAHLQMDAEERMESGLAPEEARRAAHRDFGNVPRVAEDTRAAWGWITAEQCLRDTRYGLRNLWNRPAFTVVAVLTLALGIGANTAIFSVVNAALLRPLPYAEPDRLVVIQSVNQTQGGSPSIVAPADFRAWRTQSTSFEQMAGYSGGELLGAWIGERPETISNARVTWNFSRTFGVTPLLGSDFEESDELNPPESGMNVLLSYRAWRTRFGSDPGVVGRKIKTTTGSVTVIGVMPAEFRFPDWAEMWLPMGCCGEMERRTRYWRVVGRLRDGVSVETAQGELASIAERLAVTYPKDNGNWSVLVLPFAQDFVRDVRQPLWILMGAVSFVILIACANVAGLTLARSAARRREIAVRLALGASRLRLVRQLLVEGLLVSFAGTIVGVFLARWSIAAFFRLLPQTSCFGQLNFPMNIEDRPLTNGDVVVRYSSVTSDYFRVLKLRLIAGRVFDTRDSANAPGVVVINERLAREYFPGEDPVGRKIVLAFNNQRTPREIIGVVSNVRQDSPRDPVRPELLVHWSQAPWLVATLIIRSTGDVGVVQRAVRDTIWSIDRNLPAYPTQTLEEALNSQVATPRLYVILFGVFSAVAVALAALGIYGLLAQIVGRRRNELAIRIAVGAGHSTIIRLIVREGIRLSVAGIVLGLLGTIILTRLMRSLLFEVNPHDPLTFAAVAILLLAVAFTACYIPARRAAKTDPVAALRQE